MPSPSRFRAHGTKKRAFLWAFFLPLILLSSVLANWVVLIPPVSAASNASVSTPGHNTFQQFQQEGKGTHQGQFQRPGHDPGAQKPDTSGKMNKPLPSAEPAKMKDMTFVLDDSFVLHRPTMKQRSQPAKIQGTAISTGTTPFVIKGSDGRLEVDLPRGSLDLSQATLADGSAPVGQLFLQIHQLSGHYIEEESILGSYQIQVVDSQGNVVQGVTLLQPVTLVYHYQSWELQDLNIDPTLVRLVQNTISSASSPTPTPTATPSATPNPTSTATPSSSPTAQSSPSGLMAPFASTDTTPTTDNTSVAMTADPTNQTLTAQTTQLTGTQTVASPPELAEPAHPDLFETSGNSGQYTYSYPIWVAPGPGGFAPQLSLDYSSQSTNERHSRTAPAGPEGEGFSLSLGSITKEQYPSSSTGGAATWYFLNGVDGVSDRLIPDPDGQSTYYTTQHISGIRIEWTGDHWKIWGRDGTYYELGNTSDSTQTDNGSTYEWDVDKILAPYNDHNGQVRTLFVSYYQDIPSSGRVRDSGIKQITYGSASTTTATSLSVVSGTVDFSYLAQTTQSPWATAYPSSYYNACQPYATTTLRCDTPLNDPNGMDASSVKSTLSLVGIKSYVGSDSVSNLAYSYSLSYADSTFWVCHDPLTQVETYCAGNHLLTSITPTVYVQGTGHQEKPVVFGYTSSGQTKDHYYDPNEQNQAGTGNYGGQNQWVYLNHYQDQRTGEGATITYAQAYGNMDGTPYTTDSQGNITDDRFDPLFCTTHSSCTGNYAHPDADSWSVQVVTQIQALGTDSSGNPTVATTKYAYALGAIDSSRDPVNCHPISVSGAPQEAECVTDNWSPGYNGTSTPDHDGDWQDYYHSEYRGFNIIYTTSWSGDLTVDYYFSADGWWTPTSNGTNYNDGQLYQEDIYQGSNETPSALLKETLNYYAGTGNTPANNPYGSVNSCNGNLSAIYNPCVQAPLETKTIFYEGNGGSSNAPWVDVKYTYDDLNSQGYTYSGYRNLTQEVISGSNLPSSLYPLTEKWTYTPDNGTNSNGIYYHDVDKVTHSEVDDNSGHVWQCQDTTYDEGAPSGTTTPAAGWPTTVTSYSTCGNSSTELTSYTGYDQYGNVVATVDPLALANPGLYSSHGCGLTTAPLYLSASWTATHYTTCAFYNTGHTAALPTTTKNALGQATNLTYDYTSGELLTSSQDPNSQTTSYSESYDSNGNETINVSQPGETGSYTTRQVENSTCTSSSTLPCYEIDSNSSLYPNAVSRTFYDALGRSVETRTPGPTPGDDTVVMTVYNDQLHTVWQSEPFEVADGSGWIDPNGAKDINGNTPAGTTTFYDALGRVIATQDLNWNSSQEPGIACSTVSTLVAKLTTGNSFTACTNYSWGQAVGDSTQYELTTTIDPNEHVSQSFADALGNVRYTEAYRGLSNWSSTSLSFHGTNDSNWNYVQSLSVQVNLTAGNNMLIFANAGGWAPDIDRITVGGTNYEAEASSNTLGGGAKVASCSACSGGEKVGFLGNGGTLQFNNVNVASTGSYTLTIYYVDGDAGRSATLSINGSQLSVTRQTQTQYNALNEPTSVATIDEQPQSGESPTGVTTTMTYDDLGRLLTEVDPDQGTFTYSYDPDGHVTSVVQTSGSNSRTLGLNYDLLGRVGCEQTAAPTGISWNGVCSAGSPLLQNTYDTTKFGTQGSTDFPVGRLTQSVATTYFPDGTSATVTDQFQYDQRGRTITAQMQFGLPSTWNVTTALPAYQLTQLYNDADQPTTTSTNANGLGYTFTQVYDSTTGVLTGLSNNGSSTANLATLAYNVNGLLSQLNFSTSTGASGLATEQFGYDGDLRPTSATAVWASGSGQSGSLFSQARSYDNAGNVTSLTTSQAQVQGQSASGGTQTEDFCYDEQNRLLWAGNSGTQPGAGNGTCGSGTLSNTLSGAGYSSGYAYTNLGQLWQSPTAGGSQTSQYLYCDSSHPHQVSGIYALGATCSNRGSAYYSVSYDPWGNVTARSFNTVTSTLSYDQLNQMVQWSAGSNQEQYIYDSSGERVLKRSTNGGTTTMTVYAFGLEELQYQSNGTNLGGTNNTYYYSLGGLLIGKFDGTNTTFFMTDGLGSVVASFSNTAGSAAVLGNQTYEPYGKAQYQQENMGTSKGYTGQYNDNLSGLDYYGARYYDPIAGVFLSPDSVQGNDSGMNPYSYVAGNPESLTDPTGHGPCEENGKCLIETFENVMKAGISFVISGIAFIAAIGVAIGDVVTLATTPSNHPDCPAGRCIASSFPTQTPSTTPATPPAPWGNGDPFVNNRDMPGDMTTTQALSFPAQPDPAPGTIAGFVDWVVGKDLSSPCSFTANTPVATPKGEQAISDLQVGDKVMAYNPKTHKMEAEPVLHVWKHTDSDLIDLTITIETPAHDGKPAAKKSEVIHTTSEHPFLTKEQGFTPAGQLKVGMHIQRADGSFGVVTGWKTVKSTKTMYNLEVQQDHTFAVGDGEWVVHNECDSGELGDNLEAAGFHRSGNQQAHHVVPCATVYGANPDPDAKALVELAMEGGFDINGSENGRWMWPDRNTAFANGEAYHANAPAYQAVVDHILGSAYRALVKANALDPATAYGEVQDAISMLNARIDELGRLSQSLGKPVGLC